MGALHDLADPCSRPLVLRTRHLVGRSRACHLCLDERSVSGEHAVIRWRAGSWWVRDLGSRNGTFVDDTAIQPGQDIRLNLDSVLRFGGARRFVVARVDAPRSRAVRACDGHIVEEIDGMIALPSAEDPEVTVVPTVDGWIVESEDGSRPIADLQELAAGGEVWRVHLPAALLEQTLKRQAAPMVLSDATLHLGVTPDEEHVEAKVRQGRVETSFKPLAHWYAVLTLARARLDQPEEGWIDRETLCRMLRLDRNGLNVQLYRARRQLMRNGVQGVDRLIERRGSKLRLGLTRVQVVRLD